MTRYIDSVRAALEEMAQIEEKKKMKKIPENDYENDEDDDDDDDEEDDDDNKKKNGKKDMDEAMDSVDPKAVKKDFKDRKDKDIDNDGDVDDSDEYLHKKRKAISKAKGKNEDEPEGEKGETAVMNPKKEDKVAKESTIRDRLMSIWEDAALNEADRAGHYKSATKPEPMPKDDERSAKKMKDVHGAPNRAGEIGKEADTTDAAERSSPSKNPRPNDNMMGDKNVINKIANAYKKLGSGKDM